MNFLLLGLDSLIACLAIGPIASRRALLPLAALFGLADGLGFLGGAALGWHLADGVSDGLETGLLIVLGGYLLGIAVLSRQTAAHSRGVAGRWPIWVLPWILALDNLTYGLVTGHTEGWLLDQAGLQALASALLGLVGLLVAAALPRLIPALRHRTAATSTAGSALVVAGGIMLLTG